MRVPSFVLGPRVLPGREAVRRTLELRDAMQYLLEPTWIRSSSDYSI
jgi:hypothetical protein